MVNEFYLSSEFRDIKENSITLTERNDQDAASTRIIRATHARHITLMTRAFGRGIDFIVDEQAVKDVGGVHIIQAFISEEESETVQIQGRTARQGNPGSYQMIID